MGNRTHRLRSELTWKQQGVVSDGKYRGVVDDVRARYVGHERIPSGIAMPDTSQAWQYSRLALRDSMNERLRHFPGKSNCARRRWSETWPRYGAFKIYASISVIGIALCPGPPTTRTLCQSMMSSQHLSGNVLVILASCSTVWPSPTRKSSNSCTYPYWLKRRVRHLFSVQRRR